mgnify:CR=1 FL=1
MASILNVDQINNAAGTSAVTIDPSTGKPSFPNGVSLPAGGVIQVVHNTQTGTGTTITNTSYTDTGLSVSITPSSISSKILVFANTVIAASPVSDGGAARYDIRLVNSDASVIACDKRYVGTDSQGSGNQSVIDALQGYFSPASTSSQTFKIQIRKANGSSTQASNLRPDWHNNAIHTITAMEIAQ